MDANLDKFVALGWGRPYARELLRTILRSSWSIFLTLAEQDSTGCAGNRRVALYTDFADETWPAIAT
jgi:hypothetical protein